MGPGHVLASSMVPAAIAFPGPPLALDGHRRSPLTQRARRARSRACAGSAQSAFARLVANIMVMGGGVLGRAFLEAYKQALQSARSLREREARAACGARRRASRCRVERGALRRRSVPQPLPVPQHATRLTRRGACQSVRTRALRAPVSPALRAFARSDGGKASRAGLRGGGISVTEARSILDVKPNATAAEVEEAYARLHAMNAPANGGSSYLQSKIANARAALSAEAPAGSADGDKKSGGAK